MIWCELPGFDKIITKQDINISTMAIMNYCVEQKLLDILKWAYIDRNCRFPHSTYKNNIQVTTIAIQEGHQKILQWYTSELNIELTPNMCQIATKAGQYNILKWLLINGY